jgi:predicted NBD/HSP70 family sugar kinase/biotin operon repressor
MDRRGEANEPFRAVRSGGSQRSLRELNSQVVLDALGRLGPSSQADLARETGLSRATVNNIVKRLNDLGVLSVGAGQDGRSTTVARRSLPGVALAFDVGLRRIHGIATSLADGRQADVERDVELERPGALDVEWILETIPLLVDELGASMDEVVGVAVTLCAPLDSVSGQVSTSAGLRGWAGLDIRALFQDRVQVPLYIDNDVNAAALAERYEYGAGRDFVFVQASEGLGASLMIEGQLYRGRNGMAGQISHLSVDERGPLCACGNRGCLSAVASGASLLASLRAVGRELESVTAIVDAAEQGDPMCASVLTEAARYVGLAVSHLIKITGMQTVIVGGEMAASERYFVAPLRRAIEAHTLRNPVGETHVLTSQISSSAALLGGLQLVGGGMGMAGPSNATHALVAVGAKR